MKESMKNFLRQVSIFRELNSDELSLLAEVATQRDYPKDSSIIRQGDPGESLLLVRSGKVEIVLERPPDQKVHLSTFERGGFFGEMSLLDGSPRSATAIALENSVIVEINRETFMKQISKDPKIALNILKELSTRFRETDRTVNEFADKIYAEAYKNLEGSVNVWFDQAKRLYESTEKSASNAINTVEKSWENITRMIYIVAIALTLLTSFGTYIGISTYNDINEKKKQINKIYEEAKDFENYVEKVKNSMREIDIANEKLFKIDKIRESIKIDEISKYKVENGNIDKYMDEYTINELKQLVASFNYSNFLLKSYLKSDKKEPEIVLEVARIYLELAEKKIILLRENEIDLLIRSLLSVLQNVSSMDWYARLKIHNSIIFLLQNADSIDSNYKINIINKLNSIISLNTEQESRFESSHILSDLEIKDVLSKIELMRVMNEEKNPHWRRTASAIGLIKMREKEGWDYIVKKIRNRNEESFWIYLFLGELGIENLERYGISNYKDHIDIEKIRNNIIREYKYYKDNYLNNVYLKKYIDRIIESLIE